MSLFDMIAEAEGTPAANYLGGGRTLIKISRVSRREPTAKLPKASFRIDGEILQSTNPTHADQIGMQGTMNLNFKFAEQDLAKMRRALTAALGAAEGRQAREEEITISKSAELCGPTQPLLGAVVAVVATEKPQKGNKDKVFTHYEVEMPNEKEINSLFPDEEAA